MSKNKKAKRENAARDAIKRKRKHNTRASKFKNTELKAILDGQAQLLYTMSGSPSETSPSTEANVHDLTAVLGAL